MKQRKPNKKWIRPRHRFVRNLAWFFLMPVVKLKYGASPERFSSQGKRPYLILYNHQTPFDQFFVGASFRGTVYYLATEDIFSNGLISKLLRFLAAPIPIVKQTVDASAVKNVLRVAREGGTIAIAPEGNRTYSGRTGYINPTIAALARKIGLPIALYRIEGGYGVQPRWSDKVRRGRIRSFVARVIEPEEYAAMSNDELLSEILGELNIDEGRAGGRYVSRKRAEYLERCFYVCPFCGFSVFRSAGSAVTCENCGRSVEYGADKRLTGRGFDFPYANLGDWYDCQNDFVRALDPAEYSETPAFRDTSDVYRVRLFKKKELLRKSAAVELFSDRVVIGRGTENELALPFPELTGAAVLGRNKLNLYHGENVYQFKGGKRFNALKYMNLYHHFKNVVGGNKDGKFLGL